MFINDEKYFNFLIENKMTAGQFLFCYFLSTMDRNHRFFNRYVKEVGMFTVEEVKDLVNRGYIEDFNSPGEAWHDNFMVLDKFKEAIFIDSDVAFEELWKAYPIRLQQGINGIYPMAKTTNLGKEGLQRKYAKFISNDLQKHNRVMEALNWYRDRSKIAVGIEKFILNHLWEDWFIEKEANGDEFGHIEVR